MNCCTFICITFFCHIFCNTQTNFLQNLYNNHQQHNHCKHHICLCTIVTIVMATPPNHRRHRTLRLQNNPIWSSWQWHFPSTKRVLLLAKAPLVIISKSRCPHRLCCFNDAFIHFFQRRLYQTSDKPVLHQSPMARWLLLHQWLYLQPFL